MRSIGGSFCSLRRFHPFSHIVTKLEQVCIVRFHLMVIALFARVFSVSVHGCWREFTGCIRDGYRL